MSQVTEVEYLDGEFTITEVEPSTIAEISELIGEAAVVEEATSNLRYRNKYPRVYKLVSDAIASAFPRPVKETKTLKDGTERKVLVSPNDHLRAALFGTKDDEDNVILAPLAGAREKLAALFAEIAPAQALYVKGERTGGGGKIAQGTLDASNGFFAQGIEVVEEKIGIIEGMVPGYKIGRDSDGNPTVESLARGIQALEKHLQNAAKKQTAAALGK